MVCISRNVNNLTVYKDLKRAINWNHTQMVPLNNNDMVYITPTPAICLSPIVMTRSLLDGCHTTTNFSSFMCP